VSFNVTPPFLTASGHGTFSATGRQKSQWSCDGILSKASMIAFAAALRLQNGFESDVIEEIDPNLKLAG
jgi:hypothetical protein